MFMKFQKKLKDTQRSQCIVERLSRLGSKEYSNTMKKWDPYEFKLLVMDSAIALWTTMIRGFTRHSSYEEAMWFFLEGNGVGEDLVYVEPVDFVLEPYDFLPKVENSEVRAWALEVHALWKKLSRKVSSSVHDHPELHTVDAPFCPDYSFHFHARWTLGLLCLGSSLGL